MISTRITPRVRWRPDSITRLHIEMEVSKFDTHLHGRVRRIIDLLRAVEGEKLRSGPPFARRRLVYLMSADLEGVMDGNPESERKSIREGDFNKRGLSRRSILNIMKGIGAGIGAVAILGKETIVAFAQQIPGVLGSLSATTTIPGNQLPPPPPEFGGYIKESAKDSKPWWPPRVVPPAGAPNVLLIMTDDKGYGVSAVIQTQFIQNDAKRQLKFGMNHDVIVYPKARIG